MAQRLIVWEDEHGSLCMTDLFPVSILPHNRQRMVFTCEVCGEDAMYYTKQVDGQRHYTCVSWPYCEEKDIGE
jgi:hypothetical protein